MSDSRCKCPMAISLAGDGCRYCQPQEYIDRLSEWLDEERQQLEQAEARADACQQEAQIWKQEARTQAATVAEIYQELTGKTGEPGDWHGARPVKAAVLRKQAEAADEVQELITMADSVYEMQRAAKDYAQRLRQQADEIEGSGTV